MSPASERAFLPPIGSLAPWLLSNKYITPYVCKVWILKQVGLHRKTDPLGKQECIFFWNTRMHHSKILQTEETLDCACALQRRCTWMGKQKTGVQCWLSRKCGSSDQRTTV